MLKSRNPELMEGKRSPLPFSYCNSLWSVIHRHFPLWVHVPSCAQAQELLVSEPNGEVLYPVTLHAKDLKVHIPIAPQFPLNHRPQECR